MPVVTAVYTDHDEARAAATALEQKGLDASAISVRTTLPVGERAWDADLEATGDVAARSAMGGAIGAVVGALVAAGVVLVIGPDPLALSLVVAALGGAIAGAILGGFWSGAGELPVQSQAFDTYGPDQGTARVVAQVEPEQLESVRSTLADAGCTDVSVDDDHHAGT